MVLASGTEQVISIPGPNMIMKGSSIYHPPGITSKFAHAVVTHCSFLTCLHIHKDIILLYVVYFLLYLFLFQTDFVQSQDCTASRAVCNLWPSIASLCSLLIPYVLSILHSARSHLKAPPRTPELYSISINTPFYTK